MAEKRKEIQFIQKYGCLHYIQNLVKGKVVGEVEIDMIKLNLSDIRTILNGLANIMQSLSATLYSFEKKGKVDEN